MSIKKSRIAMLAYFYPPVKAVGTLRNYYVSELFRQHGYHVTVYAGKPVGYLDQDHLPIDQEINVKRTVALDYHLFDKLRRREKSKAPAKVTSETAQESRPPWISYFPFNFLVGEGGLIYTMILFFRLLINIRHIDILWSSYSPITDHYVASMIKRIKPSITWITDWRDVDVDPDWPDTPATARQRRINKAIIKNCDLVVSVCDSYMSHVKHYAPHRYMLRNGIMDKFDADGQQLDAKFSISYVGGLYGGRRDPSVVFEQVADLIDSGDIKREHIALVYAGREGAVYEAIAKRYGLQDLVDDRGTVTFAHSQEIQRSAHINLMISWASSSMSTFPAKFYEYINARRPILLLVLGSKDPEFEAIFSAKQIGDMFYDHQGATLRDSLLSSYHTYSEVGEVAYQGTEADVEEFYWQESFVAFDKYLQTLSQKV